MSEGFSASGDWSYWKLTREMRRKPIYIAIALAAIIVVGTVFYSMQVSKPRSVFEVSPIETPRYDMELEKPAPYINLTIKNNGSINETDVVVKLFGGFSNSSNQVPDQLFLVATERIDVIAPGETVTTPRIYNFGWYFFYRIEVSSSDGTEEVFNQWVPWRSWQVTVPSPG
jgi:hypothetical protein